MLFTHTTIDITPDQPLSLAGWSNRIEPYTVVESRLEANLALFEYDSKYILVVCIDSLFVSKKLRLEILNHCEAKNLPINSESLLIYASHTHFAPNIDELKPDLGTPDLNYISKTFEKITFAATNLFNKKAEHVSAVHNKGRFEQTINRRRKTWHRGFNPFNWNYTIEIGPNPISNINKDLHIIRFYSKDKCIGILWTLACHPVNYKDFNACSANYIGYIRKKLRLKYGNECPIFFIQGFAGNVRASMIKSNFKNTWNALLGKKKAFEFEANDYKKWLDKLDENIRELMDKEGKKIQSFDLRTKQSSILLAKLIKEHKGDIKNLNIQRWQLSAELNFLALSAEVVNNYIDYLSPYFNKEFIPTAYTDNCYGYLPRDFQIKEGGYEVDGFFKWFNLKGTYKPNIEKHILEGVKKVLDD